jgi:hypothetical protein
MNSKCLSAIILSIMAMSWFSSCKLSDSSKSSRLRSDDKATMVPFKLGVQDDQLAFESSEGKVGFLISSAVVNELTKKLSLDEKADDIKQETEIGVLAFDVTASAVTSDDENATCAGKGLKLGDSASSIACLFPEKDSNQKDPKDGKDEKSDKDKDGGLKPKTMTEVATACANVAHGKYKPDIDVCYCVYDNSKRSGSRWSVANTLSKQCLEAYQDHEDMYPNDEAVLPDVDFSSKQKKN